MSDRTPPREVIAEARNVRGGWVYEIDGDFQPDQPIPPEAIAGAWKVDDKGELTGEYRSNPHYQT